MYLWFVWCFAVLSQRMVYLTLAAKNIRLVMLEYGYILYMYLYTVPYSTQVLLVRKIVNKAKRQLSKRKRNIMSRLHVPCLLQSTIQSKKALLYKHYKIRIKRLSNCLQHVKLLVFFLKLSCSRKTRRH